MTPALRRLGDIARVTMGTSPKGHFYNQAGEGMPLLNGPTEFGSIYPNVTLFTTKSLRQCEAGELLFCVRGSTTGRMNWADQSYSIGRGISSMRGKSTLETKFIRYALEFRLPTLLQLAGGSTFPNLPTDTIKQFQIPYPDTRNRIASILSAYDDLIDNNLRRIELLEESARLLYKEWFVRLRFPGHEHTRIVSGVPKGWSKGTIADFYNTASGGTPSRKRQEYFEGQNLWAKTQELQNQFVIDTQEKITDQALKQSAARLFPRQTVLFAMYGATIGQLGILAFPAACNQACCALLPRNENASYIYAFLFLLENKRRLVNLSQGAAQKNVNQEIIKQYAMILPAKRTMDEFHQSLEPCFQLMLNLHLQNKKLRQARDILLPRLMSGEIEV